MRQTTNGRALGLHGLRALLFLTILAVPLAIQPAVARAETTAPAATIVNTNITSDTDWTLAGSPYNVTTSISVAPGATLTIKPGVLVQANQGVEIIINGRLLALGEPQAPITFTGTTAQPGWWYGISFNGTAQAPLSGSILEHVTVEYSGHSNYGNLNLTYAMVDITNSTFRNGAADGIRGLTKGVAHITGGVFTGNGGRVLSFADGSVNPILSDLTISGNGTDAIVFGSGTISEDRTWRSLGAPYIFASTYVAENVTLTVEPGVEARFTEGAELQVRGRLVAAGEAGEPILFTGTTAQPGWWYGISFNGTAQAPLSDSTLTHVTVEYSGHSNYGNLNLTYAMVDITNSTFRNGAADGIRGLTKGVAHITGGILTGNGGRALSFADGSVNPILSDLTISGNGTDAIVFGSGTISEDRTWRSLGTPYIFASTYVAENVTLTVEPGVEARFTEGAELQVRGHLLAQGTPQAPITFTGTTAQPGWWYGISFNGTAQAPLSGSTLTHVTVEYSGHSNYGNLNLTYAAVDITNSTFRNGAADGIRGLTKGVAHITGGILTGNGGYPIQFHDGSVNPILAGLTIQDNGADMIAFGSGTLQGQHTWRAVGVPYLRASTYVAPGAVLTVEPGVEVRFAEAAELQVRGQLAALGTAGQPIRFTSASGQAGSWYGILINGAPQVPAIAEFEHVTIEYSGRSNYANLSVTRGQAVVRHSLIQQSTSHGIQAGLLSQVTVEASQLIDNAGYGIYNSSNNAGDLVLAANNWWGDPSGPTADGQCNPGGAGSKVSTGVAFLPFLTAADQKPAPLLPSEAGILTITPRRWFAPADGLTRLYTLITLHDGNGVPLPGRTVNLVTSLGRAVSGGATDVRGQTLAYVTSDTPGDAELVAILDHTACESARSPVANVTFTSASADELMPEAEAPYFNSGIEIDPSPIVRGVPTRLSARLTNPNDFPILVDATFGFVQAGIGTVFGPAGEVTGQIIPANSDGVLSIVWTPLVDGHYCIELTYTARRADGASAGAITQAGRSQRNLNVYPGPLGNKPEKDALNKARQFTGALDNGSDAISFITGPAEFIGGLIPDKLFDYLLDWNFTKAEQISQALGGDPPRQDYTLIAVPEPIAFTPLQPTEGLSAERAAASNNYLEAALDMIAKLDAAVITLDRYGGAAAAGDLHWSSQQAAALIYYKQEGAKAMLLAADRLEALVAVIRNENPQDVVMTEEIYRAYQERLATQGFSTQEIAAAKQLGFSDAEIEAFRQERIALDPAEVAGSVTERMAEAAVALRELGNAILYPPLPVFSVSGGSGGLAQAAGGEATLQADNLARVFKLEERIQVGNPLAETATIDLRVRRIDLPSDWMVAVQPITVTLAPGEQISATVTVVPGAAAVQGDVARLAIEGYAGNQLLGGVAMDILVPEYVAYDGELKFYLPAVERN